MKKIYILLPYKENFSPSYAGAVSLYVKDTTKKSIFKKLIRVFGNTDYKKTFNLSYTNILINKKIYESGSKYYVNSFVKHFKKDPANIIEIHNRPNYLKHILSKKIDTKIVLYFHNDPLTMTGSKKIEERYFLLNYASKIIFNSEWSKKRFLEGLDSSYSVSEKLLVIYQSADKVKINFNKKKKWITFVGKLNSAKGYDLFGNAIVKILKKHPLWYGVIVGDEPRQKLTFNHPRLKKMGFINHKRVLEIYKKTSIAVACSRWNEPLGRTSLEASSRGCATIISNRGGLPETITHAIILKDLTSASVYSSINKLISNFKERKMLQKLSYNNFHHTHTAAVSKIDNYRKSLFKSKISYLNLIKKNRRIKILHVTNFNERHDGRLFFNTGRRLNNGFIRLNHSVLDFSDRDIVKHYKTFNDINGSTSLNTKFVKVVENYKPNLIVFGHADLIDNSTLSFVKTNYPDIKLAQWFLDRMDGIWEKNKYRFLSKIDYMDANFITTSPSVLNFLPNNRKIYFIPNPSDESFEVLNNFSNNSCIYDVFFALSHGVHRGILKRGKYDIRERFINKLVKITPNVKFDIYGINKIQPVWADSFYQSLSRSKMAINLSQGNPIKYYSSDRITQLIGNGLLTFIDKKTFYRDFFTDKEMIFYENLSDLSEKILKYSKDEKLRKKIARNGKIKYLKSFSSKLVADYIIKKTFEVTSKTSYLWEK
jgi:glycosyltransferase involved in cell wall biosynthesis